MKIGLLTSSRADYGIYGPLVEALKKEQDIALHLIVFGMHLLDIHGHTIDHIDQNGVIIHIVYGMPEEDTAEHITSGYGQLVQNFSEFWSKASFDLVLTLGDRWEMSAAIQSSIQFEVPLAHIHGGETTLGATDNIYRHQITLASKLHFTSNQNFTEKVIELTGTSDHVHTVGSISLQGLDKMSLPDWPRIMSEFDIPFQDFILVTVHPETVGSENNEDYVSVIRQVIESNVEQHNFLITKSNADLQGMIYNRVFENLAIKYNGRVRLVASLGKLNYFAAMKNCDFLLGNTSSGIIEAASFGKWVVNIGERQKGRLRSGNVLDVPYDLIKINESIETVASKGGFSGENIYQSPDTVSRIIALIKTYVHKNLKEI